MSKAIRRAAQAELEADFEELKAEVGQLYDKVDRLEDVVSDVRALAAQLDGQGRILVKAYENAANSTIARTSAALDTRKAGQLRKRIALKLLGALTALIPLVAALLDRC